MDDSNADPANNSTTTAIPAQYSRSREAIRREEFLQRFETIERQEIRFRTANPSARESARNIYRQAQSLSIWPDLGDGIGREYTKSKLERVLIEQKCLDTWQIKKQYRIPPSTQKHYDPADNALGLEHNMTVREEQMVKSAYKRFLDREERNLRAELENPSESKTDAEQEAEDIDNKLFEDWLEIIEREDREWIQQYAHSSVYSADPASKKKESSDLQYRERLKTWAEIKEHVNFDLPLILQNKVLELNEKARLDPKWKWLCSWKAPNHIDNIQNKLNNIALELRYVEQWDAAIRTDLKLRVRTPRCFKDYSEFLEFKEAMQEFQAKGRYQTYLRRKQKRLECQGQVVNTRDRQNMIGIGDFRVRDAILANLDYQVSDQIIGQNDRNYAVMQLLQHSLRGKWRDDLPMHDKVGLISSQVVSEPEWPPDDSASDPPILDSQREIARTELELRMYCEMDPEVSGWDREVLTARVEQLIVRWENARMLYHMHLKWSK